jgi:hypothetical protein
MFRKPFNKYSLEELFKKFEKIELIRKEFCNCLIERLEEEIAEAFKEFNQTNKDGIEVRAFSIRLATYWKGYIWDPEFLRMFGINASKPVLADLHLDTNLEVIIRKIYLPWRGVEKMWIIEHTLPNHLLVSVREKALKSVLNSIKNEELELETEIFPTTPSSLPEKETEVLEEKLTEFLRNKLLGMSKRRRVKSYMLMPIVYVLRFPSTVPAWYISSKTRNVDSGVFYLSSPLWLCGQPQNSYSLTERGRHSLAFNSHYLFWFQICNDNNFFSN